MHDEMPHSKSVIACFHSCVCMANMGKKAWKGRVFVTVPNAKDVNHLRFCNLLGGQIHFCIISGQPCFYDERWGGPDVLVIDLDGS